MLTVVLKFLVDSIAMGLLSHMTGRCLNFALAGVKHVNSTLQQKHRDKLRFNEGELKEISVCLKSSFSYAAKLLNLILREANEASSPPEEAFDLANEMLYLITSIEIYLGSILAARVVAAAKSWLPDLILALGSVCILQQTQIESAYLIASCRMKLHFPSWLSLLAMMELRETQEESPEEEDRDSEPEEFPVFQKFMEMMISLLKVSPNIQDAVGVSLLGSSVIALERKDYKLLLGLLRFICVKFVGQEDREWSELNMMLSSLPEIYPRIEREMEEESNEDARQKLSSARALLEPVWLYHVYETGRFSMMEE